MDIIDDIIDLFYRHSHALIPADCECEVFIDNEMELRKRLEKLLTEK
jgi:hypothetical protein